MENQNQRKPLSFGMTMLASAVGVVIVSALGGLLTFISMIAMVISLGSMDKEPLTVVKNNTFLRGMIVEQTILFR